MKQLRQNTARTKQHGVWGGIDGIILGGDSDDVLRIHVYADASYGVYMDGKSHTSNVITLGRGPIFTKSMMQKAVMRSARRPT